MSRQLQDKVAIVTGASNGIGRAIAETFAAEGAKTVLVARRAELLDEVAAGIRANGGEALTVAADLSKEAVVREVAAEFPDVDILINNAGAIRPGTLVEVDEATWRRYWELKVFGYVNMTRAYYAHMKKRGRGVIINIIGAAGERMRANYIAGSTGNASLMAFTKALGATSPADGIRVVGVNPATVLTDKSIDSAKKWAVKTYGDDSRWKEYTRDKPFGRAIEPYRSCEDAIATWPTTASSVGVRLEPGGHFTLCAPFGLDDNAPLEQPISEEFRVGTMTLSWDPEDERIVLEIFPIDEEIAVEQVPADEPEPEEMLLVRLDPAHARAFVKRAGLVIEAGRPSCPFCGGPIDPEGHLCVRANGFKRRLSED